jgi:hypothetical protein
MRSPAQNVTTMVLFGPIVLVLTMLIQSGDVSSATNDVLTPLEQAEMAAAKSIDQRIKIYEAASKRIQLQLQGAMSKNEFEAVPAILTLWTSLLNRSLEDIESVLKSKKKPKNLKKYEIHLRKAIKETQDYKTKTPFDQQDAFNACLVRAETIRKQFVEILFLH